MGFWKGLLVVIVLVITAIWVANNPQYCSATLQKCYDFATEYTYLLMFLLYTLAAQFFFEGPMKVKPRSRAFVFSALVGLTALGISYQMQIDLLTMFFPVIAVIPLVVASTIIIKLLSLPFEGEKAKAAAPGAPGAAPGADKLKMPKIPKGAGSIIAWLLVYGLIMYMFKAHRMAVTVIFVVLYTATKLPLLSGLVSPRVNKLIGVILFLTILFFIVWEANNNNLNWMPASVRVPLTNVYGTIHKFPGVSFIVDRIRGSFGGGATQQPVKIPAETIVGKRFNDIRTINDALSQAKVLVPMWKNRTQYSQADQDLIKTRLTRIRTKYPSLFK